MKAILICDDTHVAEATEIGLASGCGIELLAFFDPHLVEKTPSAIDDHRRIITPLSPAYRSIHGPFYDMLPGSHDPDIRALAMRNFRRTINIARSLNASHLVFHSGYMPRTMQYQAWLKHAVRFWDELLQDVPSGFHIHIENIVDPAPSILKDLVTLIDDPRVDICLDIGHAHCNTALSPVRWVEELAHRIGYVHMHDNHGSRDEHLGFGQGDLPLEETCAMLESAVPQAIWAIETDTDQVEPSLAWLIAHGFSWPRCDHGAPPSDAPDPNS